MTSPFCRKFPKKINTKPSSPLQLPWYLPPWPWFHQQRSGWVITHQTMFFPANWAGRFQELKNPTLPAPKSKPMHNSTEQQWNSDNVLPTEVTTLGTWVRWSPSIPNPIKNLGILQSNPADSTPGDADNLLSWKVTTELPSMLRFGSVSQFTHLAVMDHGTSDFQPQ